MTIHHIVTKDTIDETVLKALDSKNTAQQALIDAVKAELSSGKEHPNERS